jgi:hypothetical protein
VKNLDGCTRSRVDSRKCVQKGINGGKRTLDTGHWALALTSRHWALDTGY